MESTLDIEKWVRIESTIVELRRMMDMCQAELGRRAYFCAECGETIPTARPTQHPAHDPKCSRYASMVTY